MSMGWDYVSELRPPMDLLFISQVTCDYGKTQWNDNEREPKKPEKNLTQLQCLATGGSSGRLRFDPRQRRKDFSSNLCVQTGSGVHPASCIMGTGGPFPGGKARPGRDVDHSPSTSAEVVNE
jgi:hypothetical protein